MHTPTITDKGLFYQFVRLAPFALTVRLQYGYYSANDERDSVPLQRETILQLSPALEERGRKLAEERNVDLDTLVLEAFLEYVEEQEDIAYARERLALIRSGVVPTISLEEMEARLFGKGG